MPGEDVDVSAEPSTATDVSAGSSPAPTDGGSPAGALKPDETPPPFHEHPRFKALIGENRQLKADHQVLAQKLAALEAAARPRDEEPTAEYLDAAKALRKVMSADPELKSLLGLLPHMPRLVQGYQGVQQLTKYQQDALIRQGRSELKQLAEAADIPVSDAKTLDRVEDLVTGLIQRSPEASERFRQGDLSVVAEVFDSIKEFLAAFQRNGAAALAQTKLKTSRLPPAPKGGLPGEPAPPKLEEGKEREYERTLHTSALKRLGELLQG